MIRINGKDYDSTANTVASSSPGFEFGINQMADRPNIYEPQRTNNFEFIVPELDNILLKKAGLTDEDNDASDYISGGGELIRISMSQGFVPSFTQNAIQVKRGNTTINYAGVPQYSNGTLQLNQFIGADTYAVLAAWQNLSYNTRTEKVGLASDYKKTAWVCEYSPDYQLVNKWKLFGCWISGLTTDNLSYENNSVVKITANIIYDRAVLDYSDQA